MSGYVYIKIIYNYIHSYYVLHINIFNFPKHSCISTKYFIMIVEKKLNGEKMRM